MKKIISVLLCAASIAGLCAMLSGCGSKSGSNTLTWYMFGDKPQDLDLVIEKANEIIEPEIGLKLEMKYIDQASYITKMKNIMAANESYDLAFTGYINNYQEAVSLGGLYDITDLIKEEGLDKIMPEFYLDSAKVNGKIYGIPNVQVVSNPICLMMDKSLATEINADLPGIEKAACNAKTFEDVKAYSEMLDELFEKVHKARPNLYVMNPSYDLLVDPFYEQVLSEVFIRRDGTSDELVLDLDTEEGKLSAQKLREWYQKGYIRADIASVGNSLTSNEERKQIAVRTGTWKPGQKAIDKETYGEEQEYAMLMKPYVSRQSPLLTMISVGGNTKHPKEAVKFLKLINTNKELYNIICWGIEGKHYTKLDDTHISPIENTGYDKVGMGAWKFGNQFNSYLLENQENGVWEETEKMNNEAIKSPMLGFVPNTDVITNELANVTNVTSEYTAKREYGTIDVADWKDEYEKKIELAGVSKIRDELQKQYNEFLKNK